MKTIRSFVYKLFGVPDAAAQLEHLNSEIEEAHSNLLWVKVCPLCTYQNVDVNYREGIAYCGSCSTRFNIYNGKVIF